MTAPTSPITLYLWGKRKLTIFISRLCSFSCQLERLSIFIFVKSIVHNDSHSLLYVKYTLHLWILQIQGEDFFLASDAITLNITNARATSVNFIEIDTWYLDHPLVWLYTRICSRPNSLEHTFCFQMNAYTFHVPINNVHSLDINSSFWINQYNTHCHIHRIILFLYTHARVSLVNQHVFDHPISFDVVR
jgi:hypothetical protein